MRDGVSEHVVMQRIVLIIIEGHTGEGRGDGHRVAGRQQELQTVGARNLRHHLIIIRHRVGSVCRFRTVQLTIVVDGICAAGRSDDDRCVAADTELPELVFNGVVVLIECGGSLICNRIGHAGAQFRHHCRCLEVIGMAVHEAVTCDGVVVVRITVLGAIIQEDTARRGNLDVTLVDSQVVRTSCRFIVVGVSFHIDFRCAGIRAGRYIRTPVRIVGSVLHRHRTMDHRG